MEDLIKSKTFWLATAVISVVAFLSFLDMNRGYNSKTDIIFLPKDETTLSGMSNVLTNAQGLARTLSFYDDIAKNPEVEKPTAGLDAEKRKNYWDSKIFISRVDSSDILEIKTLSSDKTQADKLSQQAASSLIATMSKYYNIKTELDMRIVDGPNAISAILISPWALVVFSLVLGILAGLLTFFISSFLPEPGIPSEYQKKIAASLADIANSPIFSAIKKPKPAEEEKTEDAREEEKEEIIFTESKEKEIEEMPAPFARRVSIPDMNNNAKSKEEKEEAPQESPAAPAKPAPETPKKETPPVSFPEKKASAPGNLPIADEEAVQQVKEKLYNSGDRKKAEVSETEATDQKTEETQKEAQPEKPEQTEEKKDDIFREATPEEVKERLNKLLSGKL